MAKPEVWLKASPKQRQALYRTIDRLEKLNSLRLDEFVRVSTGRKVISDSYRENFRKGLVSRKDASNIYESLQARFPDAVAALDVEAFTGSVFSDFLLRFRRLGLVSLYPPVLTEPFASHRRGPEWAEEPFEISDPISFRLRLPYIYDAVIGLNGCDTGWFPLRITDPIEHEAGFLPPAVRLPNSDIIKPVAQGAQTIRTLAPTSPEAERRRGSNAFVFIVGELELITGIIDDWRADEAMPDSLLFRLAERLSRAMGQHWAITQINATGIGPY
jgi:hypothetical protein